MDHLPHIILETANFHGGAVEELSAAIDTFSGLDYPNIGIKFHAFDPDKVALPDFSWYSTVKKFFIAEENWHQLIKLAHKKKFQIWLDLFCVFGVKVLKKNLDKIFGIKLQPSVLDNFEIIQNLEVLDLRDKVLIINISGLGKSQIELYLQRYKNNFRKIVLQLGFQNFPTQIEDSSLTKVEILRGMFPDLELSYADHIDAANPFSRSLPVYAVLKGCSIVEKHICNDRENTEFDHDSALEVDEIRQITTEILQLNRCFSEKFISENEKKYYEKSLQKPITKRDLFKGQLISPEDVIFRRTDKPGIKFFEISELQQRFFILNRKKEAHDTLAKKDFQRARIAVIVAARLKSSRLKEKAILPIQGMSSIERCLDNCLKFPFVDEVILATSDTEEDAQLSQYTLGGKVKFWQGDPEDVISRYLGACDRYKVDVVVRLTGDSPVVSPEIAEVLINSHFLTGADFTEANKFAVGTNSQVYNVAALKRVIAYVGRADYSEHMTFYMTNNPHLFKLNYVDLPENLISDYRLTLDYHEDLEMFNELFIKLDHEGLEASLVNVFKVLGENPDIPRINAHKAQIYKTNQELIKKIKEKTRIEV